MAKEILLKEDNVKAVQAPVTVVGDGERDRPDAQNKPVSKQAHTHTHTHTHTTRQAHMRLVILLEGGLSRHGLGGGASQTLGGKELLSADARPPIIEHRSRLL
jgi:hypothetical protein